MRQESIEKYEEKGHLQTTNLDEDYVLEEKNKGSLSNSPIKKVFKNEDKLQNDNYCITFENKENDQAMTCDKLLANSKRQFETFTNLPTVNTKFAADEFGVVDKSKSNQNVTDNIPTPTKSEMNNNDSIKVICRFRPLNSKEKLNSKDICVDFLNDQNIKINSKAERNSFNFGFDKTYDSNTTQQDIFETSARPIIQSVLEGFNATILAYGQTASGKTHTMTGVFDDPEHEGIIPRMIRYIYNVIKNSSEEIDYTVKISMIEDLFDLKKLNLNIREEKSGKGIYIEGLTEKYAVSEQEVIDLMKYGSDNRAVGETNMNDKSSRSHSLFIITVNQNNIKESSAKIGKLFLVDLAGSEKLSKTGATGIVLDEAKMINKSLTTLGMVINSLTDGKSTHIPYRESKLTRILQESLGGNTKTSLIITCSPSSFNEAETLSTLRFGKRAKNIKNKPKINKEVTIGDLKNEINKLENELARYKAESAKNAVSNFQLDSVLNKLQSNFNKEETNKNNLELNSENMESDKQGSDLAEINTKYEDVSSKVVSLEEENKNLFKQLQEAQSVITRINNEKQTYETMLDKYNTKIKVLEDKVEGDKFKINCSTFKILDTPMTSRVSSPNKFNGVMPFLNINETSNFNITNEIYNDSTINIGRNTFNSLTANLLRGQILNGQISTAQTNNRHHYGLNSTRATEIASNPTTERTVKSDIQHHKKDEQQQKKEIIELQNIGVGLKTNKLFQKYQVFTKENIENKIDPNFSVHNIENFKNRFRNLTVIRNSDKIAKKSNNLSTMINESVTTNIILPHKNNSDMMNESLNDSSQR